MLAGVSWTPRLDHIFFLAQFPMFTNVTKLCQTCTHILITHTIKSVSPVVCRTTGRPTYPTTRQPARSSISRPCIAAKPRQHLPGRHLFYHCGPDWCRRTFPRHARQLFAFTKRETSCGRPLTMAGSEYPHKLPQTAVESPGGEVA